jgi:hypothetical protein
VYWFVVASSAALSSTLMTRPVSSAYRLRALVTCACGAPANTGFEVLNKSKAGSSSATPNSISGTRVWLSTQTLPKYRDAPMLRLCFPRCQFSVLSMFQLQALLAEYAF